MDFATRLRQLREWRQLTQTQLGDLVGVGQSTIGNYEAGIRWPKLNRELPVLADALGVPVHELFTDTPPEQIGITLMSHPLRMEADMILTASREAAHFQAVERSTTEARWAELFAVIYPKVVAGGGELSREDARSLELMASERGDHAQEEGSGGKQRGGVPGGGRKARKASAHHGRRDMPD